MPRPRPHVVSVLSALALAAPLAAPLAAVAAQDPAGSVATRSPNMVNNWVVDPGTVQFNFLHRFTESGAPEHQISNSPTFHVAAGVFSRFTAGFNYATSSDIAPGRPNEWEFFGRLAPFGKRNSVADVSLQAGYNWGAASTDAELALARGVGPVRVLGAARGFTNAFRAGDRRVALAGGLNVRVARWLALAGDVGSLMERRAGERIAWSGGVQIGIPTTPHSFSIHATNANTGTLQGASVGTGITRWGFEYTVPITLARYIPSMRPKTTVAAAGADGSAESAPVVMNGDTVRVEMKALEYAPVRIEVKPGTTVVWVNNAPLEHTVTADDKSFDSGLVGVGKRWSYTFAKAGTFPYHCTPHPFMKGVVVVK